MPKEEVEERLDELVAFTELGDAIHRPLNTYSSGMRARVQFVVATAVAPRILLIDEALSVGDKDFRQKSRSRVEEIIDGAGTLFMVNHSLDELRNFCTRGIWLHEGQLKMDSQSLTSSRLIKVREVAVRDLTNENIARLIVERAQPLCQNERNDASSTPPKPVFSGGCSALPLVLSWSLSNPMFAAPTNLLTC